MPTLDTSLLIGLIRHDPEAMRTLAGDGEIVTRGDRFTRVPGLMVRLNSRALDGSILARFYRRHL
jgi:hypothetical protein